MGVFKIPLIVGKVVVNTFVNAKVLVIFNRLQGISTIRALKFQGSRNVFTVNKSLTADFAFELSAPTAIIIDILMWSTKL